MWVIKSSSIVPTTIQCIGLGPNGLLVVSSSGEVNIHRLYHNREYSGDACLAIHEFSNGVNSLISEIPKYTDVKVNINEHDDHINNIRAVSSSGNDIYLIATAWAWMFPTIVDDDRIIPIGYNEINEDVYLYDKKRRSNHVYSSSSYENEYKYRGWYGTISSIVGNHLMFCPHGSRTITEYDLVRGIQTYLPKRSVDTLTYRGEYVTFKGISIGMNVEVEKDGIMLREGIPNNIYQFTNEFGRWDTRVTGITSIDNYVIVIFNNTDYASECHAIAVRYNIEDGSYIDSLPVVRRINRNRVAQSNMDHMTSNGRLMVGIDTPKDTICIMDKDMNIINYFKPKSTLGGKSSLYKISKMTNIVIDYDDSIHLVTDEMTSVLTMDLDGKLLNVLTSPRLLT